MRRTARTIVPAPLMACAGWVRTCATTVAAVSAALLLTGCPGEGWDETHMFSFGVELAYDGTYPREPIPQILTVGPADVEALDLEVEEVWNSFGSFRVVTSMEVTSPDLAVEEFEYCLKDPMVIRDAATDDVVHTVPPGTCFTERTMEIG